METSDLLAYVAGVLDRLGLRYFVTGSMATISYGEPRFTNVIDVVVDLPATKVRELCAAFPEPDFYVSEESARRAVHARSQFNIIQPGSGLKIGVMVPAQTPFNRSRFLRARELSPVAGTKVRFAAPEDAILMKLVYFRAGGSDKHLRDISGILKILRDNLDFSLIEYWAGELGVSDIWNEFVGAR